MSVPSTEGAFCPAFNSTIPTSCHRAVFHSFFQNVDRMLIRSSDIGSTTLGRQSGAAKRHAAKYRTSGTAATEFAAPETAYVPSSPAGPGYTLVGYTKITSIAHDIS